MRSYQLTIRSWFVRLFLPRRTDSAGAPSRGGTAASIRSFRATLPLLLACWMAGERAQAATTAPDERGAQRIQTIELAAGWNAIFLEVDPPDPTPGALFAGTPVEIAAGYQVRSTAAQFVSNPGADLFRRAGWGVWYASTRPDAFLKTLHAVNGRQAYLIQSREAFTWKVSGYVVSDEVQWQANAFNLVGFSVIPAGGPTFGEFFAGSKSHRLDRIYRLQGGTWRQLPDAGATTMRPGEAFWIYCEGASSYQGPLQIQTPIGQRVMLGSGSQDVILRNTTPHPLTPRVEHVAVDGTPVPLAMVVQAVGGNTLLKRISAPQPDGAWVQPLPELEAGAALRLPFEARREAMQQARQVSLLKITTDLGTIAWVPVVAARKDLEEK